MIDGGARGAAFALRASGPLRGAARAAVARACTPEALRSLRACAPVFAAAALAAFALKAFYARASAEQLRFVLAPTAALVEGLTGVRFEAEPGAGYLSRERAYLIAPACAGLNYALAAFATLVLGFGARFPRARTAWLLASAVIAFAATLLVNAARIALDLALPAAALPAWLPRAQAHRLEGVALYLGSLWLLHAGVERCFAQRGPRWRAALLPLGAYLTVVLLLPALNGATARPEFWAHARVVLASALSLGAALVVA
ncbi:MAG TPA: exosortase K, partial [Myxococcota bacterium]